MLTVHPGSSRALRSPFHAASRQPAPSASQAVPGGRQQDLGAKGSWPALAPSSGSSEGPPAPRGLQEERCQHGSSSAALERLQEAASSSEPSCFTIIQVGPRTATAPVPLLWLPRPGWGPWAAAALC